MDQILSAFLVQKMGGNDMSKNRLWTFFVLDFDGTYNNEEHESTEIQPVVYMIPLEKQKQVENAAKYAGMVFNLTKTDECIGDIFEYELRISKIPFKIVGDVDLTFGERQTDYLADYIPKAVI